MKKIIFFSHSVYILFFFLFLTTIGGLAYGIGKIFKTNPPSFDVPEAY